MEAVPLSTEKHVPFWAYPALPSPLRKIGSVVTSPPMMEEGRGRYSDHHGIEPVPTPERIRSLRLHLVVPISWKGMSSGRVVGRHECCMPRGDGRSFLEPCPSRGRRIFTVDHSGPGSSKPTPEAMGTACDETLEAAVGIARHVALNPLSS